MSVFNIVHRALPPLSLFRRRSSLKDKSPTTEESQISERSNLPELAPDSNPENEVMRRDVYDTPHIAVKCAICKDPVWLQSTPPPDKNPGASHSPRRTSVSQSLPTRAPLGRGVSWANIVSRQDRWTDEHERQLMHAQRQLEKCQKAWSSEQEVWLANVEALSEEKEAHMVFVSARNKQLDDEQYQFRKAWKRRRSSGDEEGQIVTETDNRLGKLRRLQRYGYPGQRLGVGSTLLAVKG